MKQSASCDIVRSGLSSRNALRRIERSDSAAQWESSLNLLINWSKWRCSPPFANALASPLPMRLILQSAEPRLAGPSHRGSS